MLVVQNLTLFPSCHKVTGGFHLISSLRRTDHPAACPIIFFSQRLSIRLRPSSEASPKLTNANGGSCTFRAVNRDASPVPVKSMMS